MVQHTILVTGPLSGLFGQEESAVLQGLSELAPFTPDKIKVLLVRQATSSAKPKALLPKYQDLDVQVTEGDIHSPQAIFDANPQISQVYSFTSPLNELRQATKLIDASIKSGVSHFVFSSVDRGGDKRSWTNPTNISYFAQKHKIELYLREQCKNHRPESGKPMTWTILRQTGLMESFNPMPWFGVGHAGLMYGMEGSPKQQFVSIRDIGRFGAKALLRPDQYAGRAIGLAGDEITLDDARSTYSKVANGLKLGPIIWITSADFRWIVPDLGDLYDWLLSDGYGVDIAALRREDPELQSFEKWLTESSRFKCGPGNSG